MHTYCIWGGDGHTKMAQAHTHTPLSQDQPILEDYAKMKAIPCKSVENKLEDTMKTMENETAQAKSDGQNMELPIQIRVTLR